MSMKMSMAVWRRQRINHAKMAAAKAKRNGAINGYL
jgi:hypothetical protein